jgi:ubiquinone/menaquinone biosynthesis C-methylase UbiE
MDDQMKIHVKEVSSLIGESWKTIAVSAGITAGLFDELSMENPVSIGDIIKKNKYSSRKLEKWFYYIESLGIVIKENDKYRLTEKGLLFSRNSPYKDLLGLFQITDYFMQSAVNSKENFKINHSQDSLTKGKLSNDYHDKVTDNLSSALLEIFKVFNVGQEDSLLDFGCGSGHLLRALSLSLPLMNLTGIDLNFFAIEKGIKMNKDLGNKIKMINGDILKNMSLFPDKSHDWITGINLFHFMNADSKMEVIDNMIRICKKGIFFTEAIIEASPMTAGGNALLPLLWNDFTGFFKKTESDKLNEELKKKYKNFIVNIIPIIQGTSNMVVLKNTSA